MSKRIVRCLTLPMLFLFGGSLESSAARVPGKNLDGQTGTLEKMIVAHGNVSIDLDVNRLNGISSTAGGALDTFRFEVRPNSFFKILVFNNALRGSEPGSMELIWGSAATLPGPLSASAHQLAVEKTGESEPFDLVVRDGKTGFVFFNIEGNLYEYNAAARFLKIRDGRILLSEEFARKLGRPSEAGEIVGKISIGTAMSPIEVTSVVNGVAQSAILPPRSRGAHDASEVFVPGPDVIVGDLTSMQQFGSSGTQVGLAVGTDSCNNGDVELDWFALPNPDHPVIPQNLYRMSGGTNNDDRFEQIGQSWLKHAFTALQSNICNFGCTPSSTGGTHLGVGCSDPYTASLNGSQTSLGSRAWVNPFTGVFPGSNPSPVNHTGHTHTGTTHRILVEADDLNTAMNAGATYYAEAQYVTPHEYAWCQAHPGQCNMYNNASYRRFNVTGTTSFSFTSVGATVRMTPAINAWTGATINQFEPAPGADGIGFIGCKVTSPSLGVWHYEYAVYNQNLDRGIQSFSVPLGCGVAISNVGFHAPLNHPGIANDGTPGDAGFSNDPWSSNQAVGALIWNTETSLQNQNANAIRWGTLYNFRFDSNRPPQAATATIGFYKTGAPVTVGIQAPSPDTCDPTPTPSPIATPTPAPSPTLTPTATPTPNPTPTPTPIVTPTPEPTPTPTPILTPTPTPTPNPSAQAINLSTRMRVQTGDGVGIGGFIVAGSAPKHVLIRAIGPSLTGSGVPNVLADPVLELHGPGAFVTITNDNWRDDPAQEALIEATGIAPVHDLESAIDATLPPGAYTALVRGKDNTAGAALVEVYDLDPAAASKLDNMSTRAFVSTSDNVVIAGFMLGSGGPDRVVVRGLGPSLANAGVPNVLADPMLELHDANGELLIANNDWQDDPIQSSDLIFSGLAPTNYYESAIVANLPPGLYTALLAGRNNGTGVGLIEVYDGVGP